MDTKTLENVVLCTLSYLNNTKSYTAAFRKNLIEAFEAGFITEDQYSYMLSHTTTFIKKIEIYENIFSEFCTTHKLN
ncbi:hypothetical protein EDL79_02265 [Ehrlichia ruminantium]|uniref:Uncharacterized protein n=1 Tax=Ehrlichia ruminantium TaxID=779 RepID=A0AAE6UJI2_EHRRU|nr:hypothetical protein [Ehrlichia ruminantium]QGR02479.1 hypothetical protein EDL81_02240 [Ehrlichia ruminantium]QGR03401.1 hypothetical protein EDL80_02255 [Ehrlichia ruminantium]QGR04328.1 hypothetical protein EDL79_02265 [Ehrlichia ruminantium]